MSLNKNYLTIFFLIFNLGLTYCQKNERRSKDSLITQELDAVVITATQTKRQLSSLPLPAQIISQKELKAANSVRLSDILNEQTGILTVPDFGGGEGVQMQGIDSQYTMILIDGVPLIGRSAGTLDLNRVTVGNIKQIEVVKGPSSSLFGSGALGGVINIITEKPKQELNGDISFRQASFGTNDLSANISHKKETFGVNAFINRFGGSGYDLNPENDLQTVDPFETYTFNTQFTYDLDEKTDFFLSGRYFLSEQEIRPTEELEGVAEVDEWNLHFKTNHSFNKSWSSILEFYSSKYTTDEELFNTSNILESNSFFNQLLMRPEIRTTYKANDQNTFIGGFGMNHETLDRSSFSASPIFNAPYVYAQWDTDIVRGLNVILGARYDAHNEYESRLSPKIAAKYDLNEVVSFKGSVGYGFKAPDFRQLYFNFSNSLVGYTVIGYNAVPEVLPQLIDQGQIANLVVDLDTFQNELKPENSIGINIGTDLQLHSTVKVQFNLFRNDFENLIETQVIANKTNGQNVFSYFNLSEVFTQGFELSSTWRPNMHWKIMAGYQLLYARDKEAEQAFKNGEVFARETPSSPAIQLNESDYFGLYNRSRHMANFRVFYTYPKWDLETNIRTTYRSKYGLFDSNGNGYLDAYDDFVNGYGIVDFAINKTFFSKYKLGIGMDNLLDFTDPQNITNIPGRIIYANLNINF
jgi:outer membrane receptor for ferrienterochelin and colicins